MKLALLTVYRHLTSIMVPSDNSFQRSPTSPCTPPNSRETAVGPSREVSMDRSCFSSSRVDFFSYRSLKNTTFSVVRVLAVTVITLLLPDLTLPHF